jgi:hypothetical protein
VEQEKFTLGEFCEREQLGPPAQSRDNVCTVAPIGTSIQHLPTLSSLQLPHDVLRRSQFIRLKTDIVEEV